MNPMLAPQPVPLRRASRRGLSLIEIVIMTLIAATAGVAILSMGQANTRLSQVNEESLLARQIALDMVEYFATNFSEAKSTCNTREDYRSIYESHSAFRESLDFAPGTRRLFEAMKPKISLRLQYNVEVPVGSGNFYTGLHRLLVVVEWKQIAGAHHPQFVSACRMVSEIL